MAREPRKASPATGRKVRRVYLPLATGTAPGALVPLSPEQQRHLISALRHGAGDTVHWFDGQGVAGVGELQGTERSGFQIALLTREDLPPAGGLDATLLLALPRRDSLAACVEFATIAGVTTISLGLGDHSAYRPGPSQLSALLQRLTDIAIDASEQSGRFTVPALRWLGPLAEHLPAGGTLACTAEELEQSQCPSRPPSAAEPLLLAIGPEGGWSPRELAAFAAAGWTGWHLPEATLTTVAACGLLPGLWRYGAGMCDLRAT
ncbi:MAG: Ribosomal RNA small subunit methyltransferase E [bacterium]|nr:Ribosomal RNA small subunit methyltransferase E [bacterium]